MTCIVGVEHAGKVTIGGDSAGVAGWNVTTRADEKVFKVGKYGFGFTSSFRMGQLLRYGFAPPQADHAADLDGFMATTFVDAVRARLKEGGYAQKDKEVESGGTFLVGIRGTIYKIESDYQIGRSVDGYMACGCGEGFALGAMHASNASTPRGRLNAALEAAAYFSGGVTGPFHTVTT